MATVERLVVDWGVDWEGSLAECWVAHPELIEEAKGERTRLRAAHRAFVDAVAAFIDGDAAGDVGGEGEGEGDAEADVDEDGGAAGAAAAVAAPAAPANGEWVHVASPSAACERRFERRVWEWPPPPLACYATAQALPPPVEEASAAVPANVDGGSDAAAGAGAASAGSAAPASAAAGKYDEECAWDSDDSYYSDDSSEAEEEEPEAPPPRPRLSTLRKLLDVDFATFAWAHLSVQVRVYRFGTCRACCKAKVRGCTQQPRVFLPSFLSRRTRTLLTSLLSSSADTVLHSPERPAGRDPELPPRSGRGERGDGWDRAHAHHRTRQPRY